jgi:erythronate-4-phosphate dehydrogenase
MKKGIVADAVIDTWEGEPDYSMALLDQAAVGTPHIAGYSFEGRVMGTVMIYKKTCEAFGFKSTWIPDNLLPPPAVPEIEIKTGGRPDEKVLNDIVRRVYDIESDDARFRAFDGNKCISGHFERLRSDYPIRREFRFTRVNAADASPTLKNRIAGLGFEIKP